jgi:hypothetical protein
MSEGGWVAKMIAIEDLGEQSAFVSLGDLERLATEDPARLSRVLAQLRTVFESWDDRTGGVFVRETEPGERREASPDRS